MWAKPNKAELQRMEKNWKKDEENPEITGHFFMGSCDWWIASKDPKSSLMFGYAILNGDWQMSEWGYIDMDELATLKQSFLQVDFDKHWIVKRWKEVEEKAKEQYGG